MVVVHLTPVGDQHVVAGSAARLTPDTLDKLNEWAGLHLEDLRTTQPDAGYADLIRDRSQIFNHFVMALPREEQGENQFQAMIDNARVMMAMMGSALGIRRDVEATPQLLVPDLDDGEEDAEEIEDGDQPSEEPVGTPATATAATEEEGALTPSDE